MNKSLFKSISRYAEDYLDCVQNAVESFCGSDAGEWQRGLDERSLWPLLDEINCPTFDCEYAGSDSMCVVTGSPIVVNSTFCKPI